MSDSGFLLPEMETERQRVARMPLDERVERAVKLLCDNEPSDGYYLAFSGGKDSCVIKKLAQMAGVRFEAWYQNTTIDPPELVRFIKREHPDVGWKNPKHGNMLHRIATRPGPPPTRMARWCCEEYKETSAPGRTKVFGVRADESPARAHRWREVTFDTQTYRAVCPIVYWTDEQVWEFLRAYEVPYCSLYDEGLKRLGCVGCMLNPQSQKREFARWPKYAEKWEQAVKANWRNHQGKLRRDGKPYTIHSRCSTDEEFWQWWLNEKRPDVFREDCQSGLLWTNEGE